MVVFKSKQPDVQVPEHLTTWDWLFESEETSPLYQNSGKPLRAFIDSETEERLNWNDVKLKSVALSSYLILRHGLRPGNTVSLFSGNSIWYPVCMFAVVRAGARVSGASAACTVAEMVYALRAASTKVLFTVPASLQKASEAAKEVGIPRSNIFLISGEHEDFKNVQQLIKEGSQLPIQLRYQIPVGMTNRHICGYLNFSSGTTGLPKPVMISHHNIIAQCYQMRQIQIDPENVKILAVMPLFHVTGTWRFCHYPIFLNGDAIMLPAFTMQNMLKAVVHFDIEELILVPPILLRLARDPIVGQFDLRRVKRWTSGAAPISPEVLRSLEERFPWTGFRQGYGATEAACIAAQPPTHYDWKYGISVGMLLSNTVAKVIDENGNELGPGETGEILAKGPQLAIGYLDDEKATAQSFDSDGYYHTGDAGYIDEEGLIYVKDRIKEMIKVKGFQVPPAELEDLLLGHELVDDCAVTSLPDEYAGELPKAYVVLKDGVPITDETGHTIFEYVKQNKTRYKWLAEIEFIDKIPKSPAGKLLRRLLRTRGMDDKHDVKVRPSSGFRVEDQGRTRRYR